MKDENYLNEAQTPISFTSWAMCEELRLLQKHLVHCKLWQVQDKAILCCMSVLSLNSSATRVLILGKEVNCSKLTLSHSDASVPQKIRATFYEHDTSFYHIFYQNSSVLPALTQPVQKACDHGGVGVGGKTHLGNLWVLGGVLKK